MHWVRQVVCHDFLQMREHESENISIEKEIKKPQTVK